MPASSVDRFREDQQLPVKIRLSPAFGCAGRETHTQREKERETETHTQRERERFLGADQMSQCSPLLLTIFVSAIISILLIFPAALLLCYLNEVETYYTLSSIAEMSTVDGWYLQLGDESNRVRGAFIVIYVCVCWVICVERGFFHKSSILKAGSGLFLCLCFCQVLALVVAHVCIACFLFVWSFRLFGS